MRKVRAGLALLLRLGLGVLFLYAALAKWSAPRAFAEDVANYRLLPPRLVPLATVGLLGSETLVGLSLLAAALYRPLRRLRLEAAAGATLLMLLFSAAVASALARDLKIECGCFGAGGSPATLWTLFRDLGFLAASALLLWLTSQEQA